VTDAAQDLGGSVDPEKVAGDIAQIAIDLLGSEPAAALAECAASEATAASASEAVAHRLHEGIVVPLDRERWPPARTWANSQDAVRALAGLPGADGAALAHALVGAIAYQPIPGPDNPLHEEVFDWVLAASPGTVRWVVERSENGSLPMDGRRFITERVWGLPGESGAYWLLKIIAAHDFEAKSLFQDMPTGRLRAWEPGDWTARLEALAEARLSPPPGLLRVFGIAAPPPESSAAQVKLACRYATRREDYLLRTVAGNVRSYRTGDPAVDVALFWWPAEGSERELLRWLVELGGEPSARHPLVAAAAAAGLVDVPTRRYLDAELDRPEWADREVPWTVDRVVEAGDVRLPDGRVSGGDAVWSSHGVPVTVALHPGGFRVRVAIATHPLMGEECAAAELVVDPDAEAIGWELLRTGGGREGYIVEVGVGCFAASAIFEHTEGLGELAELIGRHASVLEIDRGEAGSAVLFTVGPQHAVCRTWRGLSADGRVVRLVTDLGLLELDPARSRSVPWAS